MRTLLSPIVLIGITFLAALPSVATAQELTELLSSQRYSEAFLEAAKQPLSVVISQVDRQAQGNDAPAQWILADAYWRAGQKETAVQWGYIALVSTQLDASACHYSKKIIPWMMQSYQYIFSEGRRRPDLQSTAIKGALWHHAKLSSSLPTDQAWACRLGMQLDGTKNPASLRMPPPDIIKRKRADALKDLIEAAHVKMESDE